MSQDGDGQVRNPRALSKYWIFTTNNPRLEDMPALGESIDYVTWQRERGANGTEHLQGYVIFRSRKRRSWIVSNVSWLTRSYLDQRRGTHEEAVAYANKEESRIEGPHQLGLVPEVHAGERSDLKNTTIALRRQGSIGKLGEDYDTVVVRYSKGLMALQAQILRARQPAWRALTTTALIGATGLGKTRYVYDNNPHDAIYKLVQPQGRAWFDGYVDQRILLLDDFAGWLPYRFFLTLLDGYPLDLEIKGGFTPALFTEVYITSNSAPLDWYPGLPREELDPLYRRITHIIDFPIVPAVPQ